MSDDAAVGRTCPWCSAVAGEEADTCPSCGAALAQRESLGGLLIPGVTAIDPALRVADGVPMRIPGPSPSQGLADGAIVAAVVGGPVGLAALGGIAAVAAAEYLGAGRSHAGAPEHLEDVGRPSAITLLAMEKVERAEKGEESGQEAGTIGAADPWRDDPGSPSSPPAD